jgi:hypothetical protein
MTFIFVIKHRTNELLNEINNSVFWDSLEEDNDFIFTVEKKKLNKKLGWSRQPESLVGFH